MVTVTGRQLQARQSAEVGIFVDLATAAKPLSSQLTYHKDDSPDIDRRRQDNWYINYWSDNTVCCQPLSAQPLGYSTKYGNVVIEAFSDRKLLPRSLADQEQIYQHGIDKYILTDPTTYITTSIYPRTLADQDLYCKDSSIKRDGIMEWFSNENQTPRSLANQNQIYQFNTDMWRDRVIYNTMSLGFSAFEPRGQVITLSASTLGDVTTSTALTSLCALDSDTPSHWTGNKGPRGIHKHGDIIFTASEQAGIDTFKVDDDGILEHKDNHLKNDSSNAHYYDVFADNNIAYVASYNEGLLTYTYDAAGNLTFKDKWKSTYYDSDNVWGDGTFIYSGSRSYDDNGIERAGLVSFSVDSTTGAITYKDNDDRGSVAGCGTYAWEYGNQAGHHMEYVSDTYPWTNGPFTPNHGYGFAMGQNALDNSINNYWHSANGGTGYQHYFIIDLGSVKCVTGMAWYGYHPYHNPRITMQYGATWAATSSSYYTGTAFSDWYTNNTSGNYSTNHNAYGWQYKYFNKIETRYIRLQFYAWHSGWALCRDMAFQVAPAVTAGYDDDATIEGVWGDGTYVYALSQKDGLHTYSVDTGGNLTHKYTNTEAGSTESTRAIHGDSNFIYTVDNDKLHSYEADSNGALTLKNSWGNFTDHQYGANENPLNVESIPTKVPPDDNVVTFVYVTTLGGGIFRFSVSSTGVFTLIDYDFPTVSGTPSLYALGGDEDFIYTGGQSQHGLKTYAVSAQTTYTTVTTGQAAVTRTVELMPFGEFTSSTSISASVNPVSGSWTIPFINRKPTYGTVNTTTSTMTGASARILLRGSSESTAVPSSSSTIGDASYQIKYPQQAYGTVNTTTSIMTGAAVQIPFGEYAFAPISTTASTVTGAFQKIYLNTSDGASTSDFWVGQTTTGSLPVTSELVTEVVEKDIYFDVHYNKYVTLRISDTSTIQSTENLPSNYVITANGYGIQGITTFKSEVSFTARTEDTIYTVNLKPFFYVIR